MSVGHLTFGENAMALALCRFAEQFLSRMSICATIRDEQLVAKCTAEKTDIDEDAKNESGHWYHVAISVREPKANRPANVHFHLDAVKSFGPEKPAPSTSIEGLSAAIAPFRGQIVRRHVWAECVIPKTALPKLGIINAMSGIATSAAGEKLSLTGAKMSFEQPPFDEIEWRISGEEALVAIDAFEDGIVIDDNFLVSAEAMLATGIEKFILEKAISSEDKND